MTPKPELLSELAARLGVPQLSLDSNHAVGLELEDGIWIDLQFLDREQLRVVCEIGTVNEAAKRGFLLAGLLLNNDLAEQGLPCLAYSVHSDTAMLSHSLAAEEEGSARIGQTLTHLATLARKLKAQWRAAQVIEL